MSHGNVCQHRARLLRRRAREKLVICGVGPLRAWAEQKALKRLNGRVSQCECMSVSGEAPTIRRLSAAAFNDLSVRIDYCEHPPAVCKTSAELVGSR
jgi:hypothetical protein